MSEPSQPLDWARLQASLQQAGHRQLVVLEGNRVSSLAWLGRNLPALSWSTGVWSGPGEDRPQPSLIDMKPQNGRQWLGREIDLLVWDGWQGNPPDSLAAITGSLTAGGLWFWLMPPLTKWHRFDDPDYARTALTDAKTHAFARRMAGIITSDPDVIRVNTVTGQHSVRKPKETTCRRFQIAETPDQSRAIEQIVSCGQGRRRRPMVITADRGRGKSAALGIAAITLLNAGRQHIAVTAPSAEAVLTLFRHARQSAGPDQLVIDSDHEIRLAGGGSLRFYPVDELLRIQPPAELVLVDEAAAIPAPLLKNVLLGWPRVVFASTVHGYEGSGRGFTIRFRQVLDEQTPHWKSLRLEQPIRWAVDDPLERLVSRLYLLHAGRSEPDASNADCRIEPWNPVDGSEADLDAAFGLLVDAHYRTTPGDLRQWMDDPQARAWLARRGNQVVGVLWMTREGGFTKALAEQVMKGKRRVRGHLLPQSLANHSGFAAAASLSIGRIVRIAVSDHERRRGVGRQLVDRAHSHAKSVGLDAVGTSFGASPDLLAFWQQCGLSVMRLGLQREASSGEFAVQMLSGVSNAGIGLAGQIQARLGEHWQTLVPRVWRSLAPELLLELTARLPEPPPLTPEDIGELEGFTEGARGFELTLMPLQRLTRQTGAVAALRGRADALLWCRAVLQTWNWTELQAAGYSAGRREAEDRLRYLAADLLKTVMK
ncbi:MAG: GNAT family N-acetyltransferase [Marinobacter sp.]|uniref:tRNA(Met) cytidine acetyltransferase TmcA n=1 Tax=Marinobacter sp. TaxID=50741 RepID=UPI0034A06230